MENFQITEEMPSSVIMSKGHVQLQIKTLNDQTAILEYIDDKKQK